MKPSICQFRSSRLAWLALSGLAVIALVLGGGVWVTFRAEDWGAFPRRLVDACLLISQPIAGTFWPWMTTHPLTALALAFLAASIVWALVRLGLSLFGGWRVEQRLSTYEAGRFPLLDRALRVAPEVEPARIRIFRSMRPDAFTIGLLRPKICLSVGLLETMTETEVQAVLHHEHAHVTVRDPLRLAAVRVLSDFLWFLPITRILAETFSRMAELRADETAVSAGDNSLELASAIVKTAGGSSTGPRLAPTLGGLAFVEQRVMRLLGREQRIPARIPWGPGLTSGLMIAAVLVLLIGPQVGIARARSWDPRMVMHSMMNCASENVVSASPVMDRCADPGNARPGLQTGAGT